MKLRVLMFAVLIITVSGSCQKEEDIKSSDYNHTVVVQEILQARAYTYLKVKENGSSFWMAINKQNVDKGQVLYYNRDLKMKNFTSKDLGKTFETIFFVDHVSTTPTASMNMMTGSPHAGSKSTVQKEKISIEPASGGITLADLFSTPEKFANKAVTVRGQVTRFNPAIMDRNWVHIQDGTGAEGNYDLTVTTAATVEVGDVVTFNGVITLNRDFGAGYSYAVIMEKATTEN